MLADGEVELGAADPVRTGIRVESPSPVDPQQSEHGQKRTDPYSGSPLGIERIELLDAVPSVYRLQESQH